MAERPTLEDVARRVGVSTATVSRALNTPEKVVERTRERVMSAVRELGYAPNFGARAMAAKRTNTIGAVIPTMENAIFARGLQAFQEELQVRGYHLLVASSSYQAALEDDQVRALVARGADGLLLIGQDRAEATTRFLNQRELPVVTAWAYHSDACLPSIGFDNRAAMQALAAEVISLGHSRFGYISAPTEENDRARSRLDGVRATLRAHHLDPKHMAVIETPYGIETGAQAMAALMRHDPAPTVVMCGNDVLAAGALKWARAAGLRVPGDVSITGFDDIEIATLVEPALTTVHVPHRKMGKTAAEILTAMVEERTTAASVELDTSVKLRASLAAPG